MLRLARVEEGKAMKSMDDFNGELATHPYREAPIVKTGKRESVLASIGDFGSGADRITHTDSRASFPIGLVLDSYHCNRCHSRHIRLHLLLPHDHRRRRKESAQRRSGRVRAVVVDWNSGHYCRSRS